MAEIPFDKLDLHVAQKRGLAPVYLLYGEEFFRRKAFDRIVSAIVTDDQREFALEEIEGLDGNIHEVIERVNTYSLDGSPRVVGFMDTKIFYSKDNRDDLIKEIQNAVDAGNPQKGVSSFFKLLAMLDIPFEEVEARGPEAVRPALAPGQTDQDDWIEAVIPFCSGRVKNGQTRQGGSDALANAIENGFAPGCYMIITTEIIDKRRKLYKVIKAHGVVVDCSVATGSSKAAKKAQSDALSGLMRGFLEKSGKTIDSRTFNLICEMTGFDLRTFQNSLEKLAAYTGERKRITTDDVRQVLRRTKTDPIYELTGAIGNRNTVKALFFLSSLLSAHDDIHPSAILSAILNMIRRLAVIRDFMESDNSATWRPGISYQEFSAKVAKKLEEYDSKTARLVEELDREVFSPPGKGKISKKKHDTDLFIAPDKRKLYPVYKNFEKAARFSADELSAAFSHLQAADRRIKSGSDPRLALEHLIISLCKTDDSQKNRAAR